MEANIPERVRDATAGNRAPVRSSPWNSVPTCFNGSSGSNIDHCHYLTPTESQQRVHGARTLRQLGWRRQDHITHESIEVPPWEPASMDTCG
eukprot:7372011-Pyramimonas_sp.AAC.1